MVNAMSKTLTVHTVRQTVDTHTLVGLDSVI